MTTRISTADRPYSSPPALWLIIILLLALPFSAYAWNATGHRLVAEIAWLHLSEPARTEAAQLLAAHPDLARWRDKAKSEQPRAVFIEASTWPDEIRNDARFYTPGQDSPTPLLPGFPDMERHNSWHTVLLPIDGSILPPGFNVNQLDKQLFRQLALLDEAPGPPLLRNYVLPWVIHLFGDSHQPLHLSVRRTPDGEWDRVGHAVTVSNPYHPRKSQMTLHEFWDSLPIPISLRGERLAHAAQDLLARNPAPSPGATPSQWLEESWRFARNHGYPQETGSLVQISTEFYERSKAIAEQRIVAAGYRLAEHLNRFFAPRQSSISKP